MSASDRFHDAVDRRMDAMSGAEIDAFVSEFEDEEAGMELLREQIAREVESDKYEAETREVFP